MVEAKYFGALALAIMVGQPLAGCATSSRDARDEAKITADVQAVIDRLPELDPPNQIDVKVDNHWVYLSGSANTELSIADVEAQVRKVRGVVGVTNSIGVED